MHKKVVLIQPLYPNVDRNFNLSGLGYLAENLERHGIAYKVLDMTLGYSLRDIQLLISEYKPSLIGISMMTYMYKRHYHLIESLKRLFPNIKIAVGGPHISFFREGVLKECHSIDYGFIMESEESFKELCLGYEPSQIRGIVYRDNGTIITTEERALNVDLDSFVFPTYKLFEWNKYKILHINIITSRGCPIGCIYCGHHLISGKKFRARSPRSIVQEMLYWYRNGYSRFNFSDSNFTFDRDRVYKICDEIERAGIHSEIWCGDGIRADCIDKDMLRRMREVGFKRISIGVESSSNRILKILNKGITIECIEETISQACDLGYDVELFFLIGSPGETWSDIKKSAEFALKYPIYGVSFHNLIPYPKTGLFDWVKRNGCFIKDPEDYLNNITHISSVPVFSTPQLSAYERKRAIRYLRSTTKAVQRRTIERKLGKYNKLIGKIMGLIYTNNLFQYVRKRNNFISGLVSDFIHKL